MVNCSYSVKLFLLFFFRLSILYKLYYIFLAILYSLLRLLRLYYPHPFYFLSILYSFIAVCLVIINNIIMLLFLFSLLFVHISYIALSYFGNYVQIGVK